MWLLPFFPLFHRENDRVHEYHGRGAHEHLLSKVQKGAVEWLMLFFFFHRRNDMVRDTMAVEHMSISCLKSKERLCDSMPFPFPFS